MRRLAVLILLAATSAACGPEQETPEPTSRVPAADEAEATSAGATTVEEDTPRSSVVFLGTSLTAGLGLLREEETYVARLAQRADSAGFRAEFVNAGVSGETSAGGLRRMDWLLRRPVDVLVVELGANDGLRGQDPEALEANLTAIIRRTREAYPEVAVLLAGMEAPPNLGAAYTRRFREVFPRVAARENAVLIPFLLEGVAGVRSLNQADGIHPNPDGHRRIADTVWPYLYEVLAVRNEQQGGAP